MILRRWVALELFLILGALPAAATNPTAEAQLLFDEGKRLLAEGKAELACSKLEESDRLEPDVATQFQLARCYEAIGRGAAALSLFLAVKEASRQAGNARAEQVANERVEKLQLSVPRLKLRLRDSTLALPGLSIRYNYRSLEREHVGTAMPMDSGPTKITVGAPGYKRWTVQVLIPNKPGTLELEVPELAAEPPTAAPTTAMQPVPRDAGDGKPMPSSPNRLPFSTPIQPLHRGPRPWVVMGWSTLSLGAVATGVGATLALTAKSSYDQAGALCGERAGLPSPQQCTPSGEAARFDAIDRANAGGIAMVAGLSAVALGTTVLLVARSSRPSDRPQLQAAPSLGGITLRGAF